MDARPRNDYRSSGGSQAGMSNPNIVLVDGANTVIRGYYGSDTLTNKDGLDVTGMFVYFRMMYKLIEAYPGAWFCVMWDGGHTRRRELYPEYKANRKPKNEEQQKRRDQIIQNLKLSQELTHLMGIHSVRVLGVEADDIIAYVAKENPGQHVLIVSTDKDYYQLLDLDHVSLQVNTAVYNKYTFEELRPGKTPLMWRFHHTLVGNDDNLWKVPGMGGVGAKEALEGISEDTLRYMHTDVWWKWFEVYTRCGSPAVRRLYPHLNKLRLKFSLLDLLTTSLLSDSDITGIEEQVYTRQYFDLTDLYEFGRQMDIPSWSMDVLRGLQNRRADLCPRLKDLPGM